MLAKNNTNSTNFNIQTFHVENEQCKPLFPRYFPYLLADRVRPLPPPLAFPNTEMDANYRIQNAISYLVCPFFLIHSIVFPLISLIVYRKHIRP